MGEARNRKQLRALHCWLVLQEKSIQKYFYIYFALNIEQTFLAVFSDIWRARHLLKIWNAKWHVFALLQKIWRKILKKDYSSFWSLSINRNDHKRKRVDNEIVFDLHSKNFDRHDLHSKSWDSSLRLYSQNYKLSPTTKFLP